GAQEQWLLHPDDGWHGFGATADGFNLLDPIKVTILTPGLNMQGEFAKNGIPAAIVTRYLAEHGVVVEKTGLYNFFIMFTIGITKGRWNTLLTALQQFKEEYRKDEPLWRIMPNFVQHNPRYERMGLRALCDQLHHLNREQDIARLTTAMYQSDIIPAMRPADAWAKMARRQTERVNIDQLEGRISASMVTPYPPGIPLLIPGERFNQQIVRYLQFVRHFNLTMPGFETDVHGLIIDNQQTPPGYYIDCVLE
ncbi:MAG TPA: lysine decarboxylase, partial [Halothiobacillaceae bacterium]|nr:lysine decarboxylase [Halothiobacillaceae bacterium]